MLDRFYADRVAFTTTTEDDPEDLATEIAIGSRLGPQFAIPSETDIAAGDKPLLLIQEGDNLMVIEATYQTTPSEALVFGAVEWSLIDGEVGTLQMPLGGAATVRFAPPNATDLKTRFIRGDIDQALPLAIKALARKNLGIGLSMALVLMSTTALGGTPRVFGENGNIFCDSFASTAYVNTGGATNLDTGTAGLLKPTITAEALVSPSGLTTLTDFGTSPSVAFDGTTDTAAAGCAIRSSNANCYIGKTLTAAKRISKGRYYPSNNAGVVGGNVTNVVVQLRAKTGSAPSDYANDGVLLGTTGTIADQNGLIEITNTGDTATAFDHWWFYLARVGGSNDSWTCAEAQIYTPAVTNNTTVEANTVPLPAVPAALKLTVRVKEVDSITLGGGSPDMVFYGSRNDGATFTAFTMTKKFTGLDGVSVYESDVLDVTGQSSGSSFKWKLVTANNKRWEMHDLMDEAA